MADSPPFCALPPDLWQGVSVPVIVVTDQGQIVGTNPLTDRLLEEFLGELWGEWIDNPQTRPPIETLAIVFPSGSNAPLTWAILQDYLRDEGSWEWQVEATETHPALRWIAQRWSANPDPDPDSIDLTPTYIILTAISTTLAAPVATPSPTASGELTTLQMSEVMAVLSHEYRTPLTTILMSAELLEQYGHSWSTSRCLTHYGRIREAAEYLTGVVDRMLLITRANAGRLEVDFHQLDLPLFLNQIIASFQPPESLVEKQIALDVPPNLPLLWTDSQLLSPILHNLLSNAVKYTTNPDRFPVKLRVSLDGEFLTIAVEDRGIGIPIADQKRLFHSFHRAANVGDIAGLGLGLVIVSRCTALLNGKLQFQSTIGQGSTFQVILPITISARSGDQVGWVRLAHLKLGRENDDPS